MRTLIFLALMAEAARAACSDAAHAPIAVNAWNASHVDEATTAIELDLTSNLPQATRMLAGYATFSDVLGEQMGSIALPRDHRYPAHENHALTVNVGSKVVPRILDIASEDVEIVVCVEGVVYEDGTQESFK